MNLGTTAAGIGALADDTRRALYEYVVARGEPVGREQASTALGIAQHRASFHLDRLVAEGLLEVEYRRLSGRSGPGAGRPSKLYRRADREFTVSLPPRRYDLVGDILAAAVARAAGGAALDESLRAAARDEGVDLGSGVAGLDRADPLRAVADVLATQGYEPQVEADAVVLANCPFDALARKHTELVCGLNRDFVQGVADGMGCADVEAELAPAPGRCCVTARVAD
ncbi:MAG TPA: helix-turn-helix domain-containing protein [Nocardioides sp.]|nr:helix-turn-helix domain-containing protein [Nocardioides sp.]